MNNHAEALRNSNKYHSEYVQSAFCVPAPVLSIPHTLADAMSSRMLFQQELWRNASRRERKEERQNVLARESIRWCGSGQTATGKAAGLPEPSNQRPCQVHVHKALPVPGSQEPSDQPKVHLSLLRDSLSRPIHAAPTSG